jgi:hypothetical protein
MQVVDDACGCLVCVGASTDLIRKRLRCSKGGAKGAWHAIQFPVEPRGLISVPTAKAITWCSHQTVSEHSFRTHRRFPAPVHRFGRRQQRVLAEPSLPGGPDNPLGPEPFIFSKTARIRFIAYTASQIRLARLFHRVVSPHVPHHSLRARRASRR